MSGVKILDDLCVSIIIYVYVYINSLTEAVVSEVGQLTAGTNFVSIVFYARHGVKKPANLNQLPKFGERAFIIIRNFTLNTYGIKM